MDPAKGKVDLRLHAVGTHTRRMSGRRSLIRCMPVTVTQESASFEVRGTATPPMQDDLADS